MANAEHLQPVATIEIDRKVLVPIGPEDDPESRYLGTMIVARVPHHFELLEVVTNENHIQVAKRTEYDDILVYHHAASAADGPYMTVELEGRQYVVLMDPFC